jgi:hypothetical protein
VLKQSASGVLASLRGSTYGLGKRLFIQAMGGRVKAIYDSPLHSLRPCSVKCASWRARVGGENDGLFEHLESWFASPGSRSGGEFR